MKKNTRIAGLRSVFGTRMRRVTYLFLALSPVFMLAPVNAQSGKDVVDTICAGCHATGKDGAPKIGDVKAWSSRASQGLSSLTGMRLRVYVRCPHTVATRNSPILISHAQ